MKTYMVGYDLNRPRGTDDYTKLIEALKLFNNWWHHLDSTWIIKTDLTSEQIRERLKPYLDSGDELLVARLTGEAAWYGFDDEGSNWLRNNLSYS